MKREDRDSCWDNDAKQNERPPQCWGHAEKQNASNQEPTTKDDNTGCTELHQSTQAMGVKLEFKEDFLLATATKTWPTASFDSGELHSRVGDWERTEHKGSVLLLHPRPISSPVLSRRPGNGRASALGNARMSCSWIDRR
jgi:hypothetical protein